jgi:hypothetical protein
MLWSTVESQGSSYTTIWETLLTALSYEPKAQHFNEPLSLLYRKRQGYCALLSRKREACRQASAERIVGRADTSEVTHDDVGMGLVQEGIDFRPILI